MITKFNGYDEVKSYIDSVGPGKGGYVMTVGDAVLRENEYGQYIHFKLDIAEGKFRGYYQDDYESQEREDKKWHCNYFLSIPGDDSQNWRKKIFKATIEAFEASNPGFKFSWDETELKGLLIGGLFREEEYIKQDGTVGSTVNVAKLISADAVRDGDYQLPKDKVLESKPLRNDDSTKTESSISPVVASEDELPFR